MTTEPIGLYVHIPFCKKKCAYCDFVSFGDALDKYEDTYVSALVNEIYEYQREEKIAVDTVFFGGGTPSVISAISFEKIAKAFGYPYFSIKTNSDIKTVTKQVLDLEGPVFCEVFTDTKQVWEPKSSARRLEDGSLVSPPLEDLVPFLSREELKGNMFIPMVED